MALTLKVKRPSGPRDSLIGQIDSQAIGGAGKVLWRGLLDVAVEQAGGPSSAVSHILHNSQKLDEEAIYSVLSWLRDNRDAAQAVADAYCMGDII